jgi:hypothetical protein
MSILIKSILKLHKQRTEAEQHIYALNSDYDEILLQIIPVSIYYASGKTTLVEKKLY